MTVFQSRDLHDIGSAANTLRHDATGKASTDVLTYLDDQRLFRQLAYCNGKWVNGESDTPVLNPATGDILGYTAA